MWIEGANELDAKEREEIYIFSLLSLHRVSFFSSSPRLYITLIFLTAQCAIRQRRQDFVEEQKVRVAWGESTQSLRCDHTITTHFPFLDRLIKLEVCQYHISGLLSYAQFQPPARAHKLYNVQRLFFQLFLQSIAHPFRLRCTAVARIVKLNVWTDRAGSHESRHIVRRCSPSSNSKFCMNLWIL